MALGSMHRFTPRADLQVSSRDPHAPQAVWASDVFVPTLSAERRGGFVSHCNLEWEIWRMCQIIFFNT